MQRTRQLMRIDIYGWTYNDPIASGMTGPINPDSDLIINNGS